MPVSGLLNIAWEAISSNQIAMNVTGANIANVNTPGYTRQRADFNAISNVNLSSSQANFGVRVDSIERLYNRYLETQLLDQSQKVGFDETTQEILGRVESVFNESSTGGLSDSLNQFWNSWDALSVNPDNQAARYAVVAAADNLASLFRESSNVLSAAQQDIQDSMASTVGEINTLATEIAGLNGQILVSGSEDGSTNILLDRRLELLKGIADKINISYYENTDGTLNVFLANGNIIVGGNSANQLNVTKDITGNTDIVFQDSPAIVLNSVITGGRLGAMIATGETTLAGYSDSLDRLADGIVTAVNDLHTVEWVGHDVIDDPIAAADHENLYAGVVTSGGDFTGAVNMTYAMKVTTGGACGAAEYQLSTDNGLNWLPQPPLKSPAGGVINLGDGVTLTFANQATLLVKDDIFYVNAYTPGYYKQATGQVFFDDTLTGAKNMRVSADILANPQTVVASVTGNDGFVDDQYSQSRNNYTGVVSASGTLTGGVSKTYALKITTDGLFGVSTYQISADGGPWGDGPDGHDTPALGGVINLGSGISLTFSDDFSTPTPTDALTKALHEDDIFYVTANPDGSFVLDQSPKVKGNDYAGVVSSGGVFTGDVNTTYAMRVTKDGAFGTGTYQISTDGGQTWGDDTDTVLFNPLAPTPTDGVISLGDGVVLTFADPTISLKAGDIFYVNAYAPADFLNASLIGAARDNLSMDVGTTANPTLITFNDFYATLVGRVGFDVKAVDGRNTRNTVVTNQLLAQRDSASGVSLDEEVINLMKYQFGYSTAGRLAKVANDMLDVLMALGQ
jgi:flagellar hook-associated protein FlgK